ncbi:MAG TPA: ABC transporter permease [Planctomycetales bacterium]|jgi:lipoprotein-releasing system permease protein|nr:ABC transporter permease [Planctomycetales bacterium]
MYKLLLCWRYLLTRYLALVCIVSVLLGVATLIVVNSVMAGFSTKLRDRLHGALSDIVVQSWDYTGFDDPTGKMEQIRDDPELNSRIEAMTPTVEIFAMLQFKIQGTPIVRAVRLIGIDPEGRARIGGFAENLGPANQEHPSFDLSPEALNRYMDLHPDMGQRSPPIRANDKLPPPDPPPSPPAVPMSAFVGYAIANVRNPKSTPQKPLPDICVLNPGEEAKLTTITDGEIKPVEYRYVVADYYHSEMSEQDSQYIFVPLKHLQLLRNMGDRATEIQIRLKNYDKDKELVTKRLQALFKVEGIQVNTWEDLQGPLLSAIGVERGILNVLLFMIVGVAGFGILAIFSMIVVEKTRDIGILKSLGASHWGILKIFLSYGLLLGLVGAGVGTILGVTITIYINQIEHGLALLTGQDIFPRTIYYFKEIPTDLQPLTLILINVGAVSIAVLFSILPALRAALLHPVRALRYE